MPSTTDALDISTQFQHYIEHDRRNSLGEPADYAMVLAIAHPIKWRAITDPETVAAIKSIEEQAQPVFELYYRLKPDAEWYHCAHCREPRQSYPELREHLVVQCVLSSNSDVGLPG